MAGKKPPSGFKRNKTGVRKFMMWMWRDKKSNTHNMM